VQFYLKHYRPLLLRKPSSFLFPGRFDGHKHKSGFSTAIKDLICKNTGLEVNAHLFRHIDTLMHMSENPGDIETPRCFLGHASSATTSANYAIFQDRAAIRHYQAGVRKLRARLAPSPRPFRLRRKSKRTP
jgi:integrase